MNTFKRKALASAVLGTLGVAGSAHAIYQDPNNLGQALIYPYYTVNAAAGNNWWTFVSVTNTTNLVKVVKVRFREGKNSAEALDFNLYLSPNDMWTGAIIPASADASSPAHLVTTDVSCTNPAIPAGGVDFRNYQFSGGASDGLDETLDRTREGYIEMFEMGTLDPTGGIGTAAVHGSSGSPSCTGLRGAVVAAVAASIAAPTGGLMGAGTLINVNSGRDTMYNANAFNAWSDIAQYADIGNDLPNFSNTSPASAIVVSPPNAYFASFAGGALIASPGAQAASATMMHADVLNEYVLDTASASNTDWVVTFPTRRLFVPTDGSTPDAPFTNALTDSGACEQIGVTFFNREEGTQAASGVDFSPTPPGATANSLCWESTVVSFRNGTTHSPSTPAKPSLVLASQNVTTIGVNSTFQNGWADMHFINVGASGTGLVSNFGLVTDITTGTVTSTAPTFFGLPVVGFMIRTFDNGNLTCGTATCQGNYGGSANHAYRNIITP